MSGNKVWAVDRIAAANLCRALGVEERDSAIRLIEDQLAEHRSSAFDLVIARVRTKISNQLNWYFIRHGQPRGRDFSAGFMSAQEIVEGEIVVAQREIEPIKLRSKGEMLRSAIRQARAERAKDYRQVGQVIEP